MRPAEAPHGRVRVVRTLGWTSPLEVANGLAHRDGALCLLSDPNLAGSRSFIAADPDQVRIEDRTDADLFGALTDQGLDAGVVGLADYDAGARAATGPRASVWPDLMLARYPALLVFHHDQDRLEAVGWGEDERAAVAACGRAEAWLARARPVSVPAPPAADLIAQAPEAAYEEAVGDVVARIRAGELFQANIARAWTATLAEGADPFEVFVRLTVGGGAPYGAFWRMGERALVSNSPELFLTFEAATGRVETRPIKGTRARDADPVRDAAQAADLMASRKDRAENLMIVDLMRNDLSRVCAPGTVRTERLFALESHPTVHHLVSTVTGTLDEDRSVSDLLGACFPPGSITGAPKHQAMKVIAEHEPPRGAWCGSLFLLDEAGDLSASVLIRTAAFQRIDGRWQGLTQAGAGIVADSDPASELRETEVKISALRRALTGRDA